MVKIGIIQADKFNESNYSEVIRNSFKDVIRGGINYKCVTTFEHYINEHFDLSMNQQDFDKWVNGFVYIIIPCEMLPELKAMVEMVEDIDDKFIDIDISTDTVTTRNNKNITVPTLSVKMLVCKLLKWDEGDKEQVQGIIDNWNLLNPNRVINFECTFDNETELNSFIELHD